MLMWDWNTESHYWNGCREGNTENKEEAGKQKKKARWERKRKQDEEEKDKKMVVKQKNTLPLKDQS